jgi:cation diffusion facilitator CzcD-associated flavoprotein CzcO
VARALRFLGPEPRSWVSRAEGIDADVLIVGAGQGGLANAFALRRLGITNVLIVDAAEDVAHTGVWLNSARMAVLRTAKTVTGPELGIPELGFQAWHAAQYGTDAFDELDFIGREEWARYLHWFGQATQAQVRYGTRVVDIEPLDRGLRVRIETDGQLRTVVVREIILVTGIDGVGAPSVPAIVTEHLPRQLYSHTADGIDFDQFQNKSIGILGAGTSAFDAAAVAAGAGARAVHLFSRREALPAGGPAGPRGHAGALENFHLLPDAVRWELALQAAEAGAALPPTAIKRVLPLEAVHIHLGAPFEALASSSAGQVVARAGGQTFAFDHLIVATGYDYDPTLAAPLRHFADKIATWGDRYVPPAGREHAGLARYPYLGEAYEFLEKDPGEAPYLKHIHVSSRSGAISFGRPVGDIPNLASGVRGISTGIVRNLYFADLDHYRAELFARGKPLYDRALYESRVWREPVSVAAE